MIVLVLATSCASTMPLDGGRFDDHATILEKGGVGNYTFNSDSSCRAKAEVPVGSSATEFSTTELPAPTVR